MKLEKNIDIKQWSLYIIIKKGINMADTKNVTYAKPNLGGAISVAPIGTELPKNAISELNEAFKNLGYNSEDGLTNNNTPETSTIKAWGGDNVLVLQESKEDTFNVTLIEAMDVEVLKFIYGDDNVSGTISEGITIKANAKPLNDVSIVIDMILKGEKLKRIVIPNGSLSELGEIVYKDNEAIGYEITIVAKPDEEGNTHYEYIQQSQGVGDGED